MLRKPVKLILFLVGTGGIILGGHGLYVYFEYPLGLIEIGKVIKLFGLIDVPFELQNIVGWITFKAFRSWFIPTVVLVAGFVVIGWSGFVGNLTVFMRKMKLW